MAVYTVTMVLWKHTTFLLCRAMERRWERIIIITIIIIFYTPCSIDDQGKKLEAKNKYHWWLEVRVFVSGTEGIHNDYCCYYYYYYYY